MCGGANVPAPHWLRKWRDQPIMRSFEAKIVDTETCYLKSTFRNSQEIHNLKGYDIPGTDFESYCSVIIFCNIPSHIVS